MVHWAWLIVSAMLGGMAGVFIMCIVIAGSEADKRTEAAREKER